jgi:AbrB family looped-hinge helix DNA binding protein
MARSRRSDVTVRVLTSPGKNYPGEVRITSKGQVTIPQIIRERHGLLPDTEVEFVERDGDVIVRSVRGAKPDRAARLLEGMRGAANTGLTTDEILRLTRDYDADGD